MNCANQYWVVLIGLYPPADRSIGVIVALPDLEYYSCLDATASNYGHFPSTPDTSAKFDNRELSPSANGHLRYTVFRGLLPLISRFLNFP